jgi:hypothetical protein
MREVGIVISPAELDAGPWLDWIEETALTLLVFHAGPQGLIDFVSSEAGANLLSQARSRRIEIEYSMHALSYLLPRGLFKEHPDWFRLDARGERAPDSNLCPSSAGAMDFLRERVKGLAASLVSTTSRYHFWADDGGKWCHCESCAGLSASDQNMLAMNALLQGVRAQDPEGKLSYLAYNEAAAPPEMVAPAPGIFLEFAPIERCFRHSLGDEKCAVNRPIARRAKALTALFDAAQGMVLEYWLDASLFANWKPDVRVRVPTTEEVIAHDVRFYSSLGFDCFTTFGVFLNSKYVAAFGEPPLKIYGRAAGVCR